MRIQASQVAMDSGRTYQMEQEISRKTIQTYHGADGKAQRAITILGGSRSQIRQVSGQESLFSSSASGGTGQTRSRSAQHTGQTQSNDADGDAAQALVMGQQKAADWTNSLDEAVNRDPKVQMLKKCLELLDRLTGKTGSSLLSSSSLTRSAERMEQRISSIALRYQENMAGVTLQLPQRGGQNPNGYWTRQTVASGFVRGEEHTSFQSTGTVVTADGRTLDFGISLEMSRSFESAFVSVGKEEVYTDPLVINLDTDAASLSDVSFYFDLDCDGTKEELAALNAGSGYLALDRNGNGEIDDGSELFGAQSGDGFADLAQYDEDGNGWIDENDSIFSRLKVWTRCGEGESKLLSLQDADVGAIFLGKSATQFGLDSGDGEEKGVIRSTGLYLKESGSVGTVQHLDYKA